MIRLGVWIVRLMVAGSLLTACSSKLDLGTQETITMTESTFVRQVSVKETTVSRLDDGWSVGVQWVSDKQSYVDAKGQEQRGLLARISVWNDALGQNDTLEVYEGMIFPVGEQRFQVIKLKPNSSLSSKSGSSNGYITLGQLP